MLMEALDIYRSKFTPSAQLDAPYVMAATMGVMADTDAEANYLFTTLQQTFVNMRRNARGKMPRPIDTMDGFWSEMEQIAVEHTLALRRGRRPGDRVGQDAGFHCRHQGRRDHDFHADPFHRRPAEIRRPVRRHARRIVTQEKTAGRKTGGS
jgi:alkanesulfonate monooxygenase SsuD/methylene tetrahydromethanopterin reductase-like flavin-dependent oxidoreductase (luciferase family)